MAINDQTLLDELHKYLRQGTEPLTFRFNLNRIRRSATDSLTKSGKALYTNIHADSKNKKAILSMLVKANEVATLEARFNSNNIYQFLNDVYQSDPAKFYRLRRLLVEINSITQPTQWWWYAGMAATASATSAGLLCLRPDYEEAIETLLANTMPTVTAWIGQTFAFLGNLPVLGIIYQTALLAAAWIAAFSISSYASDTKWSRLAFKTLAVALAIAGYSTQIMAAGVTTPLAAALFIAGTAVSLLKSIYKLAHTNNNFKLYTEIDSNQQPEFGEFSHKEGIKNLHDRNWNLFWVEFATALATTAVVAVLCTFPVGMVTLVACIACMILLERFNALLSTQIHDWYDLSLQERIRNYGRPAAQGVDNANSLCGASNVSMFGSGNQKNSNNNPDLRINNNDVYCSMS